MESKAIMTTQANGDKVEFGTITLQGREFTNLGSVVSADGERVTGYYKRSEQTNSGEITTWEGTHLGSARIVAAWRTLGSYVSSDMFQVEACINGIWYTGRTAGSGMLWHGKRMAKQG